MEKEEWLTAEEISKRLKINSATVSSLARRHNIEVRVLSHHNRKYPFSRIKNCLTTSNPNQFNSRFVNDLKTKIYDDYWQLDWDEFIVACDTHVPYINERIYNRMLEVAMKYGIKNFIHPGDFWNQDQFSSFDIDPEDLVTWSEEIKVGGKVLQSLKSVFDNIHFSLGSHDIRFWLMLLRQGKAESYDMPFALTGIEDIKVSKYRYANIGTEWRVTHPKSTVRPGGIPSVRLSAKFDRSMCFAHGHWWWLTMDPSAKHYLIAPGCMCDPKKIGYKNAWDTGHDEWTPGFLMVLDKNKPILFKEDSPWGIYLNGKK